MQEREIDGLRASERGGGGGGGGGGDGGGGGGGGGDGVVGWCLVGVEKKEKEERKMARLSSGFHRYQSTPSSVLLRPSFFLYRTAAHNSAELVQGSGRSGGGLALTA
jgi:hypothetical protein